MLHGLLERFAILVSVGRVVAGPKDVQGDSRARSAKRVDSVSEPVSRGAETE